MNRTDNELIVFFKENENNLYKLKSIHNELVKTQRYYLAKIYNSKIEILECLENFKIEENNLKKVLLQALVSGNIV